jgi:hypothetical protein
MVALGIAQFRQIQTEKVDRCPRDLYVYPQHT